MRYNYEETIKFERLIWQSCPCIITESLQKINLLKRFTNSTHNHQSQWRRFKIF